MLKEKMIKDLEAIGVETADMKPWKIWAHHMVQVKKMDVSKRKVRGTICAGATLFETENFMDTIEDIIRKRSHVLFNLSGALRNELYTLAVQEMSPLPCVKTAEEMIKRNPTDDDGVLICAPIADSTDKHSVNRFCNMVSKTFPDTPAILFGFHKTDAIFFRNDFVSPMIALDDLLYLISLLYSVPIEKVRSFLPYEISERMLRTPLLLEFVLPAVWKTTPEDAVSHLITDGIYGDILSGKFEIEMEKEEEKKTPHLDEISGYGEAEKVARILAQNLRAYGEGLVSWADVTSSAIFHGGPGTGKTHLARAIANSVPGAHIIVTSQSKMTSRVTKDKSYAGAMEDVFIEAKKNAPCVLVIDEIDSFMSRGAGNNNNAIFNNYMVSSLLDMMNAQDREGVVVIGACNHISAMDPALLREGRFDYLVEVPMPGREGVESILKTCVPEEMITKDLIKECLGRSAAVVNGMVRKAKSLALFEDRDLVVNDILNQLNPMGLDRTPVRFRAAVHECGHAVFAASLGNRKISRALISSDGSGYVLIERGPQEGVYEDHEDEISILMAGRVAEKLVFGDHSSGSGGAAKSDLARATSISFAMEFRCGMVNAHTPYYGGTEDSWILKNANEGVSKRIEEAEAKAERFLAAHKDLIVRMAHALEEASVLEGEDLSAWLDQVKPGEHKERPAAQHLRLVSRHAGVKDLSPEDGEAESSGADPMFRLRTD